MFPSAQQSPADGAHDVFHHFKGNPLDRIFGPQRIAVIGASEGVGSVGRAVMENLAGFTGQVFPVNPNHGSVLGQKKFSCRRKPSCNT